MGSDLLSSHYSRSQTKQKSVLRCCENANAILGYINKSVICKTSGNIFTVLSTGRASADLFCAVLGTTFQGGYGPAGESPEQSNKNDERSRKHDLYGKTEKMVCVHPRKD